jgi:hypothetical protein
MTRAPSTRAMDPWRVGASLLILVSIFTMVLSCGGSTGAGTAPVPPATPTATYVYTDLARNAAARGAFFAFARQKGISRVYFECQSPLLSAPQDLAAFIKQAKDEGIAVTLLTGSASWALTSGHAEAVALASKASAFSKDLQSRGQPVPDAVQFDVEPYLLGSWSHDLNGTANQYLDLLAKLRSALEGQLSLTVTLPYWFETVSVSRLGRTRPLSEWALEAVDGAVIMDYRDSADRIVSGAIQELTFASGFGKQVVVAVSVDPDSPDGSLASFAEEGEASMLQALTAAQPQLSAHTAFKGFAVFCYEDWKLIRP